MGWIINLLILGLAICAVGLTLYKKVRQARGKDGCGCSGCSGCAEAGCASCGQRPHGQRPRGECPQRRGKERGNG